MVCRVPESFSAFSKGLRASFELAHIMLKFLDVRLGLFSPKTLSGFDRRGLAADIANIRKVLSDDKA